MVAVVHQFTVSEVLEYLKYDKSTGRFTRLKCPNRSYIGKEAGTLTPNGYRAISFKGRKILEHRLVWFVETGDWVPELDHINEIKSDNRFLNLRKATKSQNRHRPKIIRKVHPNLPTGVVKAIKGPKFIAKMAGKYIGSFDTPEEAHEAYKYASVQKYGEFSNYTNND